MKVVDAVLVSLVGLSWLFALLSLIGGRPVSPVTHFFIASTALIAAIGWALSDRWRR